VNSRNQSYVIYLLLFIAIIAMLVYNFSAQGAGQDTLHINEVAAAVRGGQVSRLVEDDNRLRVIYNDGTTRESVIETNATLVQQLLDFGVQPAHLSPQND
jgi:cell division protease FtsH